MCPSQGTRTASWWGRVTRMDSAAGRTCLSTGRRHGDCHQYLRSRHRGWGIGMATHFFAQPEWVERPAARRDQWIGIRRWRLQAPGKPFRLKEPTGRDCCIAPRVLGLPRREATDPNGRVDPTSRLTRTKPPWCSQRTMEPSWDPAADHPFLRTHSQYPAVHKWICGSLNGTEFSFAFVVRPQDSRVGCSCCDAGYLSGLCVPARGHSRASTCAYAVAVAPHARRRGAGSARHSDSGMAVATHPSRLGGELALSC